MCDVRYVAEGSFVNDVYIVAHNIRSLYNVGSIFRNAAAFGIEKLFLTGYTAVPPRKEIAKVALGAEELVAWEYGDIVDVIAALGENGCRVFGLETGDDTISIDALRGENIALVLGNEVDGIDPETRALLDGIVEIPMSKKRSLNVAVASGVAMYICTRSLAG